MIDNRYYRGELSFIMNQESNSRQAFWIGVGSLMSFLVGIISSIFLSRLLSKGDYGTYKQVMFVYNTLLAVFTLGLPKAYSYFLPRYDIKYAKDIINKITLLFFVLGFVFSAVLFFGSSSIASLLGNEDLSTAVKIFSPTPLFLLPTLGIEGIYATYKKTQVVTAYIAVTRTITVLASVLPVIIFNGSYIHALIGFDVASFFAFIIALFLKGKPVRGYNSERSSLTIKDILNFSLPLMYASIWGLVLGSAAQFFISRYFGNEIFAEFSNGFIELPITSMVVASIATILLPRFSEKDSGESMSDEVYNLWRSSLIKSAKIVFPVLVFSAFFSRLLMICLYGDNYSASGVYFLIKNISGLFYIVPVAPILLSIGKSKPYANVHMFAALLCVVLEFLCVRLFSSPVLVAIISEVCQIIKVFLMIVIITKYSKRPMSKLIPYEVFNIIIVSVLAAIIPFVVSQFVTINKFVLLVGCFASFTILYLLICNVVKLTYKDIVYGIMPAIKHTSINKLIP